MQQVATFFDYDKEKLDGKINDFIKTTKSTVQNVSLSVYIQPIKGLPIFTAMVLYTKD